MTTKELKDIVLLSWIEATTGDKLARKSLEEKQMGSVQLIDKESSKFVENRRFEHKQILMIIDEDTLIREDNICYCQYRNRHHYHERSKKTISKNHKHKIYMRCKYAILTVMVTIKTNKLSNLMLETQRH